MDVLVLLRCVAANEKMSFWNIGLNLSITTFFT